MNLPVNQIICGDCIDEMQRLPANSIDSIITDPPYGLGFMGKEWDTFKDGSNPKYYNEKIVNKKRFHISAGKMVSVNKPICSAAALAGTYDHSRNAEFQKWFTKWAKECLRVAKPGAFLLCFGGTRTFHRLTCAIEDAGWQIRDCMMWLYGSGFPKSSDISKVFDKQACREQLEKELGRKPTKEELKKAWENFRKVIGKNPNCRPNCEGKQTRSMAAPITVQPLTAPITDLAQLWNGWGTALKPAWEPIIVAMKPIDGTFAQNAEKHGVAGLNIDGGRIPAQQGERFGGGGLNSPQQGFMANTQNTYQKGMGFRNDTQKGRWPANLILDEEAARMLDRQSGELKSGKLEPHHNRSEARNVYGKYKGADWSGKHFGGDSGGASRFFYCAKASKKERGVDNKHPTVKPLALMEHLCKLTKTPDGGIVLDPFGGSGTTALACIETGRKYVLVEKEKEYCEIARMRLKAVGAGAPIKEQKQGQKSLWE